MPKNSYFSQVRAKKSKVKVNNSFISVTNSHMREPEQSAASLTGERNRTDSRKMSLLLKKSLKVEMRINLQTFNKCSRKKLI